MPPAAQCGAPPFDDLAALVEQAQDLEIFASGGVHEIITLGAGATFHPSDWVSA